MMRALKNLIKRQLQWHGYEIYRRPFLPKGIDPLETLRAMFPGWRPRLILDVGANVGLTARRYASLFPTAEIHAFEPIRSTYAELARAAAGWKQIHPHQLALGAQTESAVIYLQTESTLNSIAPSVNPPSSGSTPTEQVTVTTLDEFCLARALEHVDLLKTDTEGHELAVLAGAQKLLAQSAIDCVIVEAGLMPGESRFIPLHALTEFLLPRGFWLVGVYDQCGWHHRLGAEFCNALFVRTVLLPP